MSDYLKTKDMALKIGYSPDFLLKNRGIVFFEGIHFFTKDKRINWKVDRVKAWIEGKEVSEQAKNILDMVS